VERYNNDDELLYLMRCGSFEAMDMLYKEYYKKVSKWVIPFCNSYPYTWEFEDLLQIAMMAFSNIIDSYRDDQKASFNTFMKLSVTRRIMTQVRLRESDKLFYDFTYISLDEFICSEQKRKYEEMVPSLDELTRPDIHLYIKEETIRYKQYEDQLSPKIQAVMRYKLVGYRNNEIAEKLQISIKSVYNAIYRYHKKMLSIDSSK